MLKAHDSARWQPTHELKYEMQRCPFNLFVLDLYVFAVVPHTST
jgi:hypothetical protein